MDKWGIDICTYFTASSFHTYMHTYEQIGLAYKNEITLSKFMNIVLWLFSERIPLPKGMR